MNDMRRAPSVLLPPVLEGSPAGLNARRLVLRQFGTEKDDLEFDFEGSPRPKLETTLVHACARDEHGRAPEMAELWQLEIGKRTECLLALSSHGFSPEFVVSLRCGAPGCDQAMEIALSLEELNALQQRAESTPLVSVEIGSQIVRLRRPTGGDQLVWLDARNGDGPKPAVRMIAALRLPASDAPMPSEWIPRIEAAMEDADPLVNFTLDVNCPFCGAQRPYAIDLGDLALRRLRARHRRLVESVHQLARAYHWTEDEIFAVPPWRREHYLALLEREEA